MSVQKLLSSLKQFEKAQRLIYDISSAENKKVDRQSGRAGKPIRNKTEIISSNNSHLRVNT